MNLTPNELKSWLEWAGVRLIAMPGGRIGPKQPRALQLDYSQDEFQVLDFRGIIPVKVAPPGSKEIALIETILLLPNICEKQVTRRILHVRSLLHPLNMRYLYPWSRVAEILKIKISSAKYFHKIGLDEVCRNAPRDMVCSIHAGLIEALATLPEV